MAKTRLIGDFGKFATAAQGTAVITGTLVADAWYIPTTVGGSSTLPTGAEVGYAFQSDGTEDITSSGDIVIPLTFTDLCDIQTWGIDYDRGESDVTTFCDDVTKYISGRTDVSGSMEGVYTIGVTDLNGGLLNKFVDIVRQADAGGALTIDKIDDTQIVILLYKQKDASSGETEQFYICPASISTFNDGANGSGQGTDPQAFSSSFRVAPNADIKFQLVSSTKA